MTSLLTSRADSGTGREATTHPATTTGGTREYHRRPAAAGPPSAGTPTRRTGGGLLRLPPWSRAPLLVWRQPVVVLAVVAAAAILGCAAGSAALFLSSAGSAAVQRGAAEYCPNATDLELQLTSVPGRWPLLDQDVTRAVTGQGFPAPSRLVVSRSPAQGGFPRTTFNGRGTGLRLVYRDGAFDQVTPTSPRLPGRGVLLTDDAATTLHARPGDTVTVAGTRVKVLGTYQNLATDALRPYWCSEYRLFTVPDQADSGLPPLVLASDPQLADDIMASAGAIDARTGIMLGGTDDAPRVEDPDAPRYSWFVPVDKSTLTITAARAELRRWQRARYDAGSDLPGKTTLYEENDGAPLLNRLGPVTEKAALIRHGLLGPVVPVAVGGSLLALLLVGAAGSYWTDRRIREVRLLSSRGVGPVGLAGKALLELAVPAAVGVVLGRLLAGLLVRRFGPSDDVEARAGHQADLAALLGLALGLLLLALVAGLRSRSAVERPVGARRSVLAAVPWELALLGLAGWSYLDLRRSPGVVQVNHVAQPRLLLISFPLVFLVGAALLGVRLLRLALRPLRRRARRMRPAPYLAISRITAAPAVSMLLLAAMSLPAGLTVYAASITSSVRYTVTAKVRLFTGGTVALLAANQVTADPKVAAVGTVVRRFPNAITSDSTVTVLAIDPATFERWAFWDRRFAGPSLAADLRALDRPAGAGGIPALAVRGRYAVDVVPDGAQVRVGARVYGLDVVDRPRHFPGTHDTNAIVVVSARNLPPDPAAVPGTEIWGDDATAIQRAVADQVSRVPLAIDASIAVSQANFAGLTYAFGYLTALAALVGVIAVGALLLYLETRQRSRVAAYAMSRRMGLSAATHLRSLLVEMGVLVGLAAVLGTVLSGMAVLLVYRRLDFNPDWNPPPVLSVPVPVLTGALAAAVVVAVAAAWYAHRAAARTRPSEILRLAE